MPTTCSKFILLMNLMAINLILKIHTFSVEDGEVQENDMNANGIDKLCQNEARNRNLKGRYFAFLDTKDRPLASLTKESDRNLPVINEKVFRPLMLVVTFYELYYCLE